MITRLALIAAVLISSAATAQDNPEPSADGSAVLGQMTQQLSAPEPAPTLPATPEKMRLVRQYLDEGTMRQGMNAAVQISYTRLKGRMLNVPNTMSKAQQAQFVDAFNRAFNGAMTSRLQRTYSNMETYFASRLDVDELKTVADFYSSGVGYKSQHNFQGMTPTERQENGQFAVDHPAISKFVRVGLGYATAAQARRRIEDPVFNNDFMSRFCTNLSVDHLRLSTCPSAQGLSWR